MERLPPPVIQLNPPGFLDLLGIKSMGSNPPNLGGLVQPTFDLESYYLRSKQIQATYSLTWATGSTQNVDATVPNGQWWWIQHYSNIFFTAVGDVLLIGQPTLSINSHSYALTDRVRVQPALAVADYVYARCMAPFWAPPGAILGSYTNGTNTSGTSSSSARILYTPVSV